MVAATGGACSTHCATLVAPPAMGELRGSQTQMHPVSDHRAPKSCLPCALLKPGLVEHPCTNIKVHASGPDSVRVRACAYAASKKDLAGGVGQENPQSTTSVLNHLLAGTFSKADLPSVLHRRIGTVDAIASHKKSRSSSSSASSYAGQVA